MAKIAKLPVKNNNLERIQVDFEVKQILDEEDGFFRFEGLASTFNNVDLVDDIVLKGAFEESIQNKIPIILWQHYSDEPIGMPEEIRETDEGLYLRARLPKEDTLVQGRVIPQVKVGSIRTMSIGFRIPEGGSEISASGIRMLKRIDLIEVSLVTFPANPKAKVSGFKSAEKILENFEGKNLLEGLSDDEQGILIEQLLDEVVVEYKKESMVTKEQLSFLDDIDVVTPRNLEKALRDSGIFSKNGALKLASFMNRSDSEKTNDDALIDGVKTMNQKIHDHDIKNQLNSILKKFGE